MERIVIIGTSGSGKTTLAFNMAARIGAQAIDLDDIYWKENWTRPLADEFRAATTAKLADAQKWVVAGNYSEVRDIVWSQADTVIWLDYSLPRTLLQLTGRSLMRLWDKKEICNGNRETLAKTFSRDGIVVWMLQSFHANRRQNSDHFDHPERFPGIRDFVRLRSPAETASFLAGITAPR